MINGLYKSVVFTSFVTENNLFKGTLIFCFVLLITIVALLFEIRRINEKAGMVRLTDEETEIGNLVYFKKKFEGIDASFGKKLHYVAYIMIDSNYIKSYYGDSAIENVIKYTSVILSSEKRSSEFAARISENGFAYVFQKFNKEDAFKKLETIMTKLNSYSEGEEKSIRPFCYSSLYNMNQYDDNCEVILFNLRASCIKLIGEDKQIIVCDSQVLDKVREEKNTVEDIKKGFENDEFKLYFQFIVDNTTKQIVSAEALSRWDNPESGIISPGKYINIMETTGLIRRLDFYMLEKVCEQLSKWKNTQFANLNVSCNFSRITLSEINFIEEFDRIVNKYDFDKSKLILEITEEAMEKNYEIAVNNVNDCKNRGFRLALDDLGNGYTSLVNLCDYPIDIVKIDREILLKNESKNGNTLFSGIVALAHSLNLKIVCEGVETKQQEELVSGTGCDYVQGWFYSKVHPASEAEAFIENYTSKNMSVYE